MGIRLLKTVMWIYLSLGVLIILLIALKLFVLPLVFQAEPSTNALDSMENVLLWWGLILLPFLKVSQALVKKQRRERSGV